MTETATATAPSAPVRDLSPAETVTAVGEGRVTLVDVRPEIERGLAEAPVAYRPLDDGGLEDLLSQPKDAPLAFLCHHGARSLQAAEYFRAQGFTATWNVVGGIDAWADLDPAIPRY